VSNARRIGRMIGNDTTSHFKTPESHGDDSETRKLDDLKPRDVERRLFAYEQLLERQRRKGFLHHIVTEDEKFVHYDNPKRRKSWGLPGHAFTSTAKPNIHSSKVMFCIWWGQFGVVYYELLKSSETITGDLYRK